MGRILIPTRTPPAIADGFVRNAGAASRRAALCAALSASLLLVACSFTGQTFNTGGLEQIVVGRTTLAEASEALGALPDQTWQQGNTVLARWGYKGTVATDAVYFRQEVWLRFGPDGTFQRVENTINVPENFRPRTQAEADQAAAAKAAADTPAPAVAADAGPADAAASMDAGTAMQARDAAPTATAPGDVPAGDAAVPLPVRSPQPLLPPGTTYTPGVSYPIGRSGT